MFSEARVELADFMPLHMKPTINSAEILATMTALRLHADHPKVAMCANSAYVLLRVKRAPCM